MRKALFATVLLAMVAFAALAWAEVRVVGEYPTGEFAVKGQIEQQVDKLIADVRSTHRPGHRLQIRIVGSADITGTSIGNDRLARDRAEQVGAVLSSNFPEAKVNVWSKGDGGNTRQVSVEWNSVPIPLEPAPAKQTVIVTHATAKSRDNNIIWILAVTAGLTVAAVLVVVLKRGKSQTLPTVTGHMDPVTMNFGGKTFSVPLCTRADGNIWTPFWNPDNRGWVFRKERGLAVKAVKSFGKDAEEDKHRSRQIQKLISDGTIKEVAVA